MLFKDAAHLAVDSGAEALTRDVMDRVVLGHDDIDYAKTKACRPAAVRRRAGKATPASGQNTGTG
jgi:hypothetical protein